MIVGNKHYRTVELRGHRVRMIEQRRLPYAFEFRETEHWTQTAAAIRDMSVRGAGAIGATGAFGLAQAALQASDEHFSKEVEAAAEGLRSTRPTAQNLFAGVAFVLEAIQSEERPSLARQAAVEAAQLWADADARSCESIGKFGAELFPDGCQVSTHCNAGWLAFVDWGSALSPLYVAHRIGRKLHVWVDETRPRGQGARLTAWELGQEGVSHTLIADTVIGSLMAQHRVDRVIVGADRIAQNGDVANKIGTYSLAVLAKAHGIPFYVAAPWTTYDPGCAHGDLIPIEERSENEVRHAEGPDGPVLVASAASRCWNPAFDVTPARLITGIVTETGIFEPSRLHEASES